MSSLSFIEPIRIEDDDDLSEDGTKDTFAFKESSISIFVNFSSGSSFLLDKTMNFRTLVSFPVCVGWITEFNWFLVGRINVAGHLICVASGENESDAVSNW